MPLDVLAGLSVRTECVMGTAHHSSCYLIKQACVLQAQEQQLEETEERVARMIIRCERLRSPLLLQSLGMSYAEGTGGLSCLCRWPTKYPR